MQFSILCYWLLSWNLLVIMPSYECHTTLLMISQYWISYWLGAIRHQANTWASVVPVLYCHMASLGHNELRYVYSYFPSYQFDYNENLHIQIQMCWLGCLSTWMCKTLFQSNQVSSNYNHDNSHSIWDFNIIRQVPIVNPIYLNVLRQIGHNFSYFHSSYKKDITMVC